MVTLLKSPPTLSTPSAQKGVETILVVDGDPDLLGLARATFYLRGLQVVGVQTTSDVMRLIRPKASKSQLPCIALVDTGFDGQDGLALGKTLLEELPCLPLIFLASNYCIEDKVRALLLGAEDYIAKPFQWAELVARVEWSLRRLREPRMAYFRLGDLEIDLISGRVRVLGEEINLSMHEYRFLCCLAQAGGRIVSCIELAEHLWPTGLSNSDEDAVKKVKLRVENKLDRVLQGTKILHNVPRIGYYLEWKSYV